MSGMDQRAQAFSEQMELRGKAVAAVCLRGVLRARPSCPMTCLQIQPSYRHSLPVWNLAHKVCMSLGEVLWDRVGCEDSEVLWPGLRSR